MEDQNKRPATFDLRTSSSLSSFVSDQGATKLCGAYSVLEVVHAKLASENINVRLSVQELIDLPIYQSSRLNDRGGSHTLTRERMFRYVRETGLIEEKYYGPKGEGGFAAEKYAPAELGEMPTFREGLRTDTLKKSLEGFQHYKVGEYQYVDSNIEKIKDYLWKHQLPLSIAIDITWPEFSEHKQGVYTFDPNLAEVKQFRHAVTAIGYEEGNVILIKNSYGDKWGDLVAMASFLWIPKI